MRIFYCAFLDVTPTMTEDTQIFTIKELHNLTSEVLCCMIETHHQIFVILPWKSPKGAWQQFKWLTFGSGTWQYIQAITTNLSDYS